MTMNQAASSSSFKAALPSILSLTLASFAVGTTETIVTGLLGDISDAFSVSVAAAGLLVSAYALTVAVASPILTAMTLRRSQRRLLLSLLGVFIAASIASALATSYPTLMLARLISACAHGVFMGVGVVVATELVDDSHAGRAIALMFTGITVANIVGVPFGVWLGHDYGWRSAFWFISILGSISFLLLSATLPIQIARKSVSLKAEIGALATMPVLLSLLVTVLGFGSTFVVFTYIVVILKNISGMSDYLITVTLLVFGVGLTFGNMIGGKTTDKWPIHTIIVSLMFLAVFMGAINFTAPSQPAVIINVFLLGAAGYAFVPAVQLRAMNLANGAPTLVSAVNIAAFNAGIGGGALIGSGVVATEWLGVKFTPWVAAVVALVAILVLLISVRFESHEHRDGA